MGKPGPDPEISPEAVLELFADLDDPCTPLTASEVAKEFDCSRRTALRRLKDLHENGEINSKKVGGRSRVWWSGPAREDSP